MQGKHDNHAKASKAGRWSENKIIASTGYVKLRVGRSHPLADSNGYAYEHLIIWVAAGKTKPSKQLLLHHKNEVRTDNRIENLELVSRGIHNKIHNKNKKRNAKGHFVNKKKAGRLLDGREWNQLPERK